VGQLELKLAHVVSPYFSEINAHPADALHIQNPRTQRLLPQCFFPKCLELHDLWDLCKEKRVGRRRVRFRTRPDLEIVVVVEAWVR
jgi:hypothetical protein